MIMDTAFVAYWRELDALLRARGRAPTSVYWATRAWGSGYSAADAASFVTGTVKAAWRDVAKAADAAKAGARK